MTLFTSSAMKLNRIPSLVNEFLNSQNKKNCIKIRETGSSLSSYKYKLEKVLKELK